MKIPCLFLFAFSFLYFFACNNPDSASAAQGSSSDVPAVADSTKVQALEAYVKSIDDKAVNLPAKQVYLKINGEKDAALVVWEGENIVRAGVGLFPPDMETRTVYYLKDNKLQYYHHREWHKKTDPPSALQLFCYFDENGIFKAQQRTVNLGVDEKPGALMGQALIDIPMNKDSLNLAVNAEWETIKKAINDNK